MIANHNLYGIYHFYRPSGYILDEGSPIGSQVVFKVRARRMSSTPTESMVKPVQFKSMSRPISSEHVPGDEAQERLLENAFNYLKVADSVVIFSVYPTEHSNSRRVVERNRPVMNTRLMSF